MYGAVTSKEILLQLRIKFFSNYRGFWKR